jgi:CRISPR-associated protein Csm1
MTYDISALEAGMRKPVDYYSVFHRIKEESEKPQKGEEISKRYLRSAEVDTAAFETDMRRLVELNPHSKKKTKSFIIMKYGSSFGSDIWDLAPDIPFGDAIRVKLLLENSTEDTPYFLVKGDLNGIQNYIYGDIRQKTAGGLTRIAKRLRGRSIIVTVLTDFLPGIILNELELDSNHLLFAGGGHFNLLLPATPAIEQRLSAVTDDIEKEIQITFGDNLHLNLACMKFTARELDQNAGECFSQVNYQLQKQKSKQHLGKLKRHFFPQQPGSEVLSAEVDEISVGDNFPFAKYIVELVTGHKCLGDGKELNTLISFRIGDNYYSVSSAKTPRSVENLIKCQSDLKSGMIYTLNNTDFLLKYFVKYLADNNIGYGFRFMGKNVPVIEDGTVHGKRVQTFEEMALGIHDEQKGGAVDNLAMIGALRLDVDDLGYIFTKKMKDAKLEHIITLSRELQYFFSYQFEKMASAHDIYVIYSGGDDAFAVGKWDKIIDFTIELQESFKKFVCGNPNVHFSAGIFFSDPHYPAGLFYKDAGDQLDNAKRQKNQVAVFNRSVDWSVLSSKIKFAKGLSKILGKSGTKLTLSVAYRLLQLIKTSYNETRGADGQYVRGSINMNRFARNIAGLRYLFARHGFNKEETQRHLHAIENELINDFLSNFDLADSGKISALEGNIVALNYALYAVRSQKKS